MEGSKNHFDEVLCADRVTQMTKTYNDVEAVTRLLEEKERDLELAARIGQTLLEKNKELEEKNERLEELLLQANERINQIKHELSMKDELLHIYTQNLEGHDLSSPESIDSPNNPVLQKKIRSLEEENLQLQLETSKLKTTTDLLEEKEQKLVNDCVQQLDDLHNQLDQFARELSEKTEECQAHKDEITSLLHQIIQLQKKIRTLTVENLDYQKTLEAAHDTENYLTREIAELKEKNEEILMLLQETQDEVRRLRTKERPQATRHNFLSPWGSMCGGDSLASELESSLRSECDYPKGYSPIDRRRHNWKIFETAKAAKAAGRHGRSGSSVCGAEMSCSASMLSTSGFESDCKSVSQRSSMYLSDGESEVPSEAAAMGAEGGDLASLYSGTSRFGRPGIPGSNDLQTALRRLSLRRANELNEMDFAREERERQLARERTTSEMCDTTREDSQTPGRCRTPDSMYSANSGYLSMTGSIGTQYYKMPEKLRIVKPLEGSVTLRHWQQLATPHLGGIFEERPGVQIKGEQKLEMEPEMDYRLSDFEEDDDFNYYPSRFQESSGVYTYTNSTVKHPSEADRVSSTFTSSTPRMAVNSRPLDNQGTSTYSMSLGLAAILNERDLLRTPSEGSPLGFSQSNISSNPTRFPSLVSDSIYNPAGSSPSSYTGALTLPTNSYQVLPSTSMTPDHSRSSTSSRPQQAWSLTLGTTLDGSLFAQSSTIEPQNPSNDNSASSSVESNLSVINKLKDTGYNLFGFITGSGSGAVGQTSSNTTTATSTTTVTADTPSSSTTNTTNTTTVAPTAARPANLHLPVGLGQSSASITTASTGTLSLATGSVAMTTENSGQVTISMGTTTSDSGTRSNLASLLARTAPRASGVIGALAKFHRDGAL